MDYSSRNIKSKKYKSQSLIGQKGVNLIERIVLEMGFIWNPSNFDAGIDGIIELRNNETEDATNFIIQVQSKATERPFTAETATSFEYLCDERDLDYWLKGNCPVIIVCSNVINGTAYWMSIKDYFNNTAKIKNRKIIFNKTVNTFDKSAKSALLNIGIPENSGYYLSPPPIKEYVYSNLLLLKNYPNTIYEAKTKYRKTRELWKALNELDDKTGINKSWILMDEKIYSFNDLSQAPWTRFINNQNISLTSFSTSIWSTSHDLAIKNKFIQLLNNTFETFAHHKGIIHKIIDRVNLYYFKPKLDNYGLPTTQKIAYNRLGRNSKQKTCDRYARKSDPKVISYFRHLAFETQFYRYDGNWYIELTPTYYFTHDGFKLHTYYESKLKGKKGLDRPETVFSETLFWTDILTRGGGFFDRSIIKFEFVYTAELDAGINDKLWLEKEDDETKQKFNNNLGLFGDEA